MKPKKLLSFAMAVLLAFAAVGCTSSSALLKPEEAEKELSALLTKVRVTETEPVLDIGGSELTSAGAELPDISIYPYSVTGKNPVNIEIFASTEKSGPSMDGWINVVAENFNKAGIETSGGMASVSIRPLSSGLGLDYIVTGVHMPDAYTPANELWGEMARAQNVKVETASTRIAGNTAGILMSRKADQNFRANHGEVTLQSILDAVLAGELLLGYTNPYASATGLNMLAAILQAFDPGNPLSDSAVGKLEQFQAKVPPVAYTTSQMRESAKKGVLDAMIMEYQAYINEPTLVDYVFTPFGVRHDNPVYALDGLSGAKREALDRFVEYALNEASQKEATRHGFNANENYKGAELGMSGAELYAAQKVWKEKKDAGRPVVAVFVADTSGSMEGTPLRELKTSLINASQYINSDNHVGLVSYASRVEIALPIKSFDASHRAYFSGAVKALSANGSTATYDAVLVGLNMLLEYKQQLPNAKLMLFVLSDGAQNEGYDLKRISPIVKALEVPIHTIGYNADLSELRTLSEINEASSVNASESDVIYNLKNIFNAQL
ncbi:MAG: VWA domain-containing protein [Clostridiales bacterium]|jgi:Ca-activated chloride channel family protein|nr:VWA domain-containing protein [Clostridiales bacterium]